MSFRENRKTKRQKAHADHGQQARRRAEDQARIDSAVEAISVSTLGSASVPFEQVAVIWGVAGEDEASALRELKLTAYAEECDAVFGVALTAVPAGQMRDGYGSVDYGFVAYGTGVRWLVGDEDRDEDD